MTNREAILKILKQDEDFKEYTQNQSNAGMSCGEITEIISRFRKKSSKYLTGSISSVLRKLVNENILEYHPTKKGPKGGHIYQIKW